MSMKRMTTATMAVDCTEAEATSEVVWALMRLRPLNRRVNSSPMSSSRSARAASMLSAKSTVAAQSSVSAWKESTVCSPSRASRLLVVSMPVALSNDQARRSSHAC